MNTDALERLRAFRHDISSSFGCRRDALVEILDARLPSSVIEHPVHLSLAPGFQRTWSSIYDALNAGAMPLPRLEHLVAEHPSFDEHRLVCRRRKPLAALRCRNQS